jgi:hypothetical protein
MSEISPEQWLEILTRPNLSAADAEKYRVLFENDTMFQAYVHAMHCQGALDAFRHVFLHSFQAGYPAEAGMIAAAYLWLHVTRQLYSDCDQSIMDHWLQQAVQLCQIMLAFSIEAALALYQNEPDRVETYPIEWEEMYTLWSQDLYAASRYGIEPDAQQVAESSEQMVAVSLSLLEQFLADPDIRLDLRAYHKVFTHLLLQVFIFSYLDPQNYYQIAACFDEIYLSVGFNLPLMLISLRGQEHLLNPENHADLMRTLQAQHH